MLLSLIIIVLIGVIAYFHYLQGFFSAAISAVLAAIAAILAIGYHEVVVNLAGNTYLPEYATAASIVAIFAVSYLVLRLLFDAAVPGYVHFALMVDRAGAIAMGLVAGVIAAGVFAIAAQALPFGPNVAGNCRYPVEFEKKTVIKLATSVAVLDAVYDQLDAEKYVRNESGDASGLWVPADSIVLKLVTLVSREGGSLDCGRSFETIHPDFLQELFGQRVGLQPGSRHSAAASSLGVGGVFMLTGPILQDDPERWTREGAPVGIRGAKGSAPALTREYKPGSGKVALVVRVKPETAGADPGPSGLIAFTPASARLAANRKNYFPIGTLESGRVLYRNVVDDPLFLPAGKSVDLVYEVPEADVVQPGKDKNAAPKVAPDVLVEFKRSARADLGFKQVTKGVTPPGDAVEVVRKEGSPSVDM
ncbi:MAG: CvpA family protein, partial [Bacillota bacterium]